MKAQAWKGEMVLGLIAYLFVGLMFLASRACAQNWVEEQTYVNQGVVTPRIDGLFTKTVSKQWGSFAWLQVQQIYSQGYAGATYSPKPCLQFALGAGLEQDKHPARIGSYVYLCKGPVSGLTVFEGGGSGFWYKVETNYQATHRIGIGTLSERYRGHGPKFEYSVPHTPIKLWFAPLIIHNSISPLFGLRWNL